MRLTRPLPLRGGRQVASAARTTHTIHLYGGVSLSTHYPSVHVCYCAALGHIARFG